MGVVRWNNYNPYKVITSTWCHARPQLCELLLRASQSRLLIEQEWIVHPFMPVQNLTACPSKSFVWLSMPIQQKLSDHNFSDRSSKIFFHPSSKKFPSWKLISILIFTCSVYLRLLLVLIFISSSFLTTHWRFYCRPV